MITEFHDQINSKAHRSIQAWRDEHAKGFFFNCKTETDWMMHTSSCPHHGKIDLSGKSRDSLTKKKKICSTSWKELQAHARKNSVKGSKQCHDCHPLMTGSVLGKKRAAAAQS
jgi:hypothetical protein